MIGGKTRGNLLKAFAGESQARNRYLFFCKDCKKEGFEQIAAIYEQTADHELSHAKNFFKFLESGEDIEITATFPAGRLATTEENLRASIKGEHEEWTSLYISFAEQAKEEGLKEVEALFRNIAKVEEGHEKRFAKVLERLSAGKWFVREEAVSWMCRKCGYIHVGLEAPQICPACLHPRAYFEVLNENY